MKALFTGGLGDFIGSECFMTEQEKDATTTLLWATRNRAEIQAAVDLNFVFPNLKEQVILFDDWVSERPTRDWQPGDQPFNIGRKTDLNLKCGLNLLEQELSEISDHSLDGTLDGIFSRQRWWQSSRISKMPLPDVSQFALPKEYVVIHPWSDAEINGREFNENDWPSIFAFLERFDITAVVVNRSEHTAPKHYKLVDLTNKTTLKETFAIIRGASFCILCASSLACFATKLFPKDRIWLKGGFPHMFTDWATYFYHGPFVKPQDIIFKDLKILDKYQIQQVNSMLNLDQGYISLL
jgi:hypothetical protein